MPPQEQQQGGQSEYSNLLPQMGTQIAGSLINNIMAGIREAYAREDNFNYNEESARRADERTRALYWDLQSPQALLEQYKAAGLSPSMMFSGGGVGAQPAGGAQSAGTAGISPNIYNMQPLDIANMELLQSQARKNNAEADEIEGLNESGLAKIAKNWADAGLSEASKNLTNVETILKSYETEIVGDTKESAKKKIREDANAAAEYADKLFWEVEQTQLSYNWDLQTFEQRAKEVTQKVLTMAAQEHYLQTGAKLNKAQLIKMQYDIVSDMCQVMLKAESTRQYGEYVKAYADNLPEQISMRKWEIAGEIAGKLVSTIGYITGGMMMDGETTTIEDFETFDKKGNPQGSTHKTTKRTPKMRGFR